ncbi:uncharacterized protein LOC122064512 [Macadamia integrifolia]|uniref:uncharacterized protein LOC122064512 n=1 Tax=Macadamia integrifolia TaxID=60698 RepID=UPI001C4F3462|nr:uncharacterized protein LOC122064512 [Macadamia integrifolia]
MSTYLSVSLLKKVLEEVETIRSSRSMVPNFEPPQIEANGAVSNCTKCLHCRGSSKLYTRRWLPENTEPEVLIFLCHGYAMECNISMKGRGIQLAICGVWD